MQKVKLFFRKVSLFGLKLKLISLILTGKYKHFIILNIETDDFTNFTKEYTYDLNFDYIGMNSFLAWKLLKDAADMKCDVDMILSKAKFQAEMEIDNEQ